jgi:hypothetical protein
MRKLILISAFILAASVSAQASQSRGLILASNDDLATKVEEAKPVEAQPAATCTKPAKPETPKAEAKAQAAQSSKKTVAHGWRDDEAKARRIAAKYGVYW